MYFILTIKWCFDTVVVFLDSYFVFLVQTKPMWWKWVGILIHTGCICVTLTSLNTFSSNHSEEHLFWNFAKKVIFLVQSRSRVIVIFVWGVEKKSMRFEKTLTERFFIMVSVVEGTLMFDTTCICSGALMQFWIIIRLFKIGA